MVVLPEIISQQIYTYGLFDEIVTGMVLRAVRQGDVVLDVGAHFGYFTLLFSHLVGESGRVISLEPTPSTYSVLRRNVANVNNVIALNVAAGSEAGRLILADYGLAHSAWNTLRDVSRLPQVLGEPSARIEVEVITLDSWIGNKSICPKLIKIDAENFEDEVVGGLKETIMKCRPRILIEAASEAALRASVKLSEFEYVPYISDRPGSLCMAKGLLEEVALRYYNILFCPRESSPIREA